MGPQPNYIKLMNYSLGMILGYGNSQHEIVS